MSSGIVFMSSNSLIRFPFVLQLKPRSRPNRQKQSSRTSGSDLFGGGKPREEVLAQRGVDASALDKRIEHQVKAHHYTPEQEKKIERVRAELTEAEGHLREANEKELPEEEYRVQVEDKRRTLHSLMQEFDKVSIGSSSVIQEDNDSLSPRSFARKERYPRDSSDPFANFGNRRRTDRLRTQAQIGKPEL